MNVLQFPQTKPNNLENITIASGIITRVTVGDADGNIREVLGDIGRMEYFVDVTDISNTKFCMWSGVDYEQAKAVAHNLSIDDGGLPVNDTVIGANS